MKTRLRAAAHLSILCSALTFGNAQAATYEYAQITLPAMAAFRDQRSYTLNLPGRETFIHKAGGPCSAIVPTATGTCTYLFEILNVLGAQGWAPANLNIGPSELGWGVYLYRVR